MELVFSKLNAKTQIWTSATLWDKKQTEMKTGLNFQPKDLTFEMPEPWKNLICVPENNMYEFKKNT